MDDYLKTRFYEKISACYRDYKSGWLQMQSSELVEKAQEIATIQRIARYLLHSVSTADASYMIRFQNPLEVVNDHWKDSDISASDKMEAILWSLRERRDAELDYDMEPEYCGQENQTSSLSMEAQL